MSNAVKIFNHFDTPKQDGVYHRLICLTGENKGKAYFILGKRIVIGRSENADVQILDLKSSREHAEIILVGDDYIITDLGSQNGVIVNDLKIKQHALSNGDKIIIGKTVYKFSKVIVKDNQTKKPKANKSITDEASENEEVKEPENKRLVLVLAGVLIVMVVLFGSDDEVDTKKKVKVITKVSTTVQDQDFKNILTQKKDLSEKSKEKLHMYFQRGLREYREGNYFRAIAEFESARQWNPKDAMANAYLRKTREKLDEEIEELFNKAIREKEALSYRKSSIAYCSIVRLLSGFPNDQRYLSALEGVKDLEVRLGLEEGEIECIEKVESK